MIDHCDWPFGILLRLIKDYSVPIISFTYTTPIATKIFNYKKVLQDFIIDDFKSKSPDCTRATCPFIYNPTGHVITVDLNMIKKASKRDVFAKMPEYRELKSINWKYNFKILMDYVENYARYWSKRENKT